MTTPYLLEEVVQTNLIGTMIACRTVGRNMIAENGGECYADFAPRVSSHTRTLSWEG